MSCGGVRPGSTRRLSLPGLETGCDDGNGLRQRGKLSTFMATQSCLETFDVENEAHRSSLAFVRRCSQGSHKLWSEGLSLTNLHAGL